MPFTLEGVMKAAAVRKTVIQKHPTTTKANSSVVATKQAKLSKGVGSDKRMADTVRPRDHDFRSARRLANSMAAKGKRPGNTNKPLPANQPRRVKKKTAMSDRKSHARAVERRNADPPTLGYKAAVDAGFQLVKTEADGNCLFNAISAQLHGNESHHNTLRTKAVDYQWENKEEFKQLMTASLREAPRRIARQDSEGPPIDQERQLAHYLDNMGKDATWGGEQEVAALSRALDVHICVYYAAAAKPVEYNVDGKRSAYLYYDEAASHYSGLHRRGPTRHVKELRQQQSDTESSSSKRSFSEREDNDGSDDEESRKKSRIQRDTTHPLSSARLRTKTPSKLGAMTRSKAAVRPSSSSSTAAVTAFSTSGSNASSPSPSRSTSPEPQPHDSTTRSSSTLTDIPNTTTDLNDKLTHSSTGVDKKGPAGPKERAATARFQALSERIRAKENKDPRSASNKNIQRAPTSTKSSERSSFESDEGSATTASTTRTSTPESQSGLSSMGNLDLDEETKSKLTKL